MSHLVLVAKTAKIETFCLEVLPLKLRNGSEVPGYPKFKCMIRSGSTGFSINKGLHSIFTAFSVQDFYPFAQVKKWKWK